MYRCHHYHPKIIQSDLVSFYFRDRIMNARTCLLNCSALEGPGIELIELVCAAMSVLNRLLLLWPVGMTTPVSVAHSLSAAGLMDQHLVATVAQYVYHRHCAMLPCLATTLLTTLAQVNSVQQDLAIGSRL